MTKTAQDIVIRPIITEDSMITANTTITPTVVQKLTTTGRDNFSTNVSFPQKRSAAWITPETAPITSQNQEKESTVPA